jgi:hypothetical protein
VAASLLLRRDALRIPTALSGKRGVSTTPARGYPVWRIETKGDGMYIGGGALALIVIVILLIWLL